MGNNQSTTNNYSNIDDSKSNSSDNNIYETILKNKNLENDCNLQENFENFSMQNNNNSLCNFDGSFNNQNNLSLQEYQQIFSNKNNNYLLEKNSNENYLLNNLNKNNSNNYILCPQNLILGKQNNINLSEKMKLKVQRAKELLDKKVNKNYEKSDKEKKHFHKFQYILESSHEFSELENNNCCKINECQSCLNLINNLNYNNNKINTSSIQIKNNSETSIFRDISNQNNDNFIDNCKNSKKSNLSKKNNSIYSNNSEKNSGMDISLNENSFSGISNPNNLSKKELKMLRNRISAQNSRDRKKKEMDDLKVITQELYNQNLKLKKQLEVKDNQMKEIKNIFNTLCPGCKNRFFSNNTNILIEEKNNYLDVADTYENSEKISSEIKNNRNLSNNNYVGFKRERIYDFQNILSDNSRREGTSNKKCSLLTGFLLIACIVGSLAFNYGFSNLNSNDDYTTGDYATKRILKEIIKNNINETYNNNEKQILFNTIINKSKFF